MFISFENVHPKKRKVCATRASTIGVDDGFGVGVGFGFGKPFNADGAAGAGVGGGGGGSGNGAFAVVEDNDFFFSSKSSSNRCCNLIILSTSATSKLLIKEAEAVGTIGDGDRGRFGVTHCPPHATTTAFGRTFCTKSPGLRSLACLIPLLYKG